LVPFVSVDAPPTAYSQATTLQAFLLDDPTGVSTQLPIMDEHTRIVSDDELQTVYKTEPSQHVKERIRKVQADDQRAKAQALATGERS
jgi:hypothetical protein